MAREILVSRVFVVATCPFALHHIDALGTARQDWSQEKNLQKLKDTTIRAETRQNWKCTLFFINDFYQMLAFKISRFSIRNLAIIFNSHKSVSIHISPCEHGRSEKTSQYLVAGRWLSWFKTVVPEVLLQIFCILLPICWRVAFWLWVLRRKIYGSCH